MMRWISAWLRNPSPSQEEERRTSGPQTAGTREVSRMPRGGKNRQSGPDEARGSDLAGGLGDEDYDWIRYLGEGRSSSGASSSRASSQSPGPPQRVKRASGPQAYDEPTPDRHPASRDTSGQEVIGGGRPAVPGGGG